MFSFIQLTQSLQDFEQLHKAMEQGHIKTQNNLGGMYANGRGITRNTATANEWYLKAANNGHAQAKLTVAGLQ